MEPWEMSDEELEAAFREAKAESNSPDTRYEEEYVEDNNDNESVEVDNLEQPNVDSDDDTDSDIEIDDGSDTDPEADVDVADENIDNAEEQPEEDNDEIEVDERPTQEVLKFRANGQDYHFTVAEMKAQFGKVFAQAMDYTKKTQALSRYRKTIDALEQAKIGQDDLNLMIDVLKGDKDAIASVLKRTGVDALDLDLENSKYVAKDYGRSDTELAIKDIVEEISSDKEYSITHNVLDRQWDEQSRMEFVKDPAKIKQFHVDVKSGMFDIINPVAQKMKVYDGASKSDLEYSKMAAQQYFDEQAQYTARMQAAEEIRISNEMRLAEAQRIAAVKAKQTKQVMTKQDSAKRKAAAPTRSNAGMSKQVNYLDDSDEAFEDWYKANVVDKM